MSLWPDQTTGMGTDCAQILTVQMHFWPPQKPGYADPGLNLLIHLGPHAQVQPAAHPTKHTPTAQYVYSEVPLTSPSNYAEDPSNSDIVSMQPVTHATIHQTFT